jgi:hypothetical protein
MSQNFGKILGPLLGRFCGNNFGDLLATSEPVSHQVHRVSPAPLGARNIISYSRGYQGFPGRFTLCFTHDHNRRIYRQCVNRGVQLQPIAGTTGRLIFLNFAFMSFLMAMDGQKKTGLPVSRKARVGLNQRRSKASLANYEFSRLHLPARR